MMMMMMTFMIIFSFQYSSYSRLDSEDVVIQLTKSKCVPCLMYGLDACYLNKSQLILWTS